MKQLILGTANFDNNYGILNNKLSINQISEILKLCFEENIKIFDSAPSYGESQEIMGNFLKKYSNFKIDLITKTPLIFSDHNIYDEINKLEKTEIEEFKYYNYEEKYRSLIVLALALIVFEWILRSTVFKSFI